MVPPDLDDFEQSKHDEAIERLCEVYPEESDFIRNSYLEILCRVSPEATIRTYLTILISREVETLLRMQALTRENQFA